MEHWKIEPCTLADAPALARNNISGFWTDPNWILLWPKDIKLEFLIEQVTKRIPNNLIRDRETLRHFKAVDPESGALVGYARWELPARCATAPEWADAQIAEVSEVERKAIKERSDSAWWKPQFMDGIDDCGPEKERILAERDYISLDYLAVHPENKGKGIATALVKSGMRLAEAVGVDLFILAFPAGLNVYKRLGFKEVHRGYQDDTMYGGSGYMVYLLTYEVKK
ncbi:acetyltransferase [Colletotrichum truncatum]|uniref:Acetyltransferase n=1 Tax=Colletotrichum truncatum TaxID=5467 RepID=A0ACC3YPJ6_COLTU|nr:acetyltransferase [Colletotrichum truncatum]KAF6796918.1 acetyltransferase [Colletotrichum truncatum]